jgi:hypothetical protein
MLWQDQRAKTSILFHTLVLRDGILSRMLPWSVHDPKGQVEQKPLKRRRELRGFKEKTTPAGIKLWWKSWALPPALFE